MSQQFQVLRCVECKIFQVHIVKKSSNKWNCKVCNTKQEVQRVYGQGVAKDCRLVVQNLNATCGFLEEQKNLKRSASASGKQHQNYSDNNLDEFESDDQFLNYSNQPSSLSSNATRFTSSSQPSSSKWAKYSDNKSDSKFL